MAKQKKPRTVPYHRRCKRCDEVYPTFKKYSEICEECKKIKKNSNDLLENIN